MLDDLTDTRSDKDRETRGQGIANVLSPLFGGMAGCAMIGQSIILTSGARGRLSTLWVGHRHVRRGSLRRLRPTPMQWSIVMIATTATVVLTHDLSRASSWACC